MPLRPQHFLTMHETPDQTGQRQAPPGWLSSTDRSASGATRATVPSLVDPSEADRITAYDVVADPDRLSRLSLAVLSAER